MKIWLMKRNCALTPRRLSQFYAALICFSLTVGIGFLIVGVWMIMIFTLIELSAVTLGFLVYARHALDFEEIRIEGTKLTIIKFIGYKTQQFQFNTRWTQLEVPTPNSKVFLLSSEKQKIELGQFLRLSQQQKLLAELKPCLG
jgi:uncharacterized membrane protein